MQKKWWGILPTSPNLLAALLLPRWSKFHPLLALAFWHWFGIGLRLFFCYGKPPNSKNPKPRNYKKKHHFMLFFLSFLSFFWSFWVLGPILAHQTAKFQLSGQFCFSRHPWGPWGHQTSGMKPESADLVTDIQPAPSMMF